MEMLETVSLDSISRTVAAGRETNEVETAKTGYCIHKSAEVETIQSAVLGVTSAYYPLLYLDVSVDDH